MDLRQLYLESASELINSLEESISLVKKDLKNLETKKILSRQAHTLRGNSMQAGEYFIAYLASKIETISNNLGNFSSNEEFLFILDIFNSLKLTFKTLYMNSKKSINLELLNRLNEFSKIEYENLEKELLNGK